LLRRITLFVLRDQLAVREFELGFHLVDAPEMAKVNEQFLQHTGSTDVITFDHSDQSQKNSLSLCGEIFISVPDAIAQAREFKTTWQSELVRYVIHGLLHLRGFDDLEPALRREMKREENRLLKFVEQSFPVQQLARS
jgi:probable rRNA maturation factor